MKEGRTSQVIDLLLVLLHAGHIVLQAGPGVLELGRVEAQQAGQALPVLPVLDHSQLDGFPVLAPEGVVLLAAAGRCIGLGHTLCSTDPFLWSRNLTPSRASIVPDCVLCRLTRITAQRYSSELWHLLCWYFGGNRMLHRLHPQKMHCTRPDETSCISRQKAVVQPKAFLLDLSGGDEVLRTLGSLKSEQVPRRCGKKS